MSEISSEAKKAGVLEPEKPVSEMTEEELKAYRTSFDRTEGIDEEDESNGSN